MNPKIFKWLMPIVIFIVALVFQFKDHFIQTDLTAEVISVYDGDTFRAKIAEIPGVSRVRIRDIDCFERKSKRAQKQVGRQKTRFHLSEEEIYSRGDQAKTFLEDLFKQTENSIVVKINPNDLRDKYGRVLAYVFVNGIDVGEKLLKTPYCFPYKRPKNFSYS